jgi:zinc protease
MKTLLIAALLITANLAHAALDIESWTLPNGAKVLFVENHTIPIVDINVDFDAGERRNPEGKEGLASLTNAMLARGLREARIQATAPNPVATIAPAMSEAEISDAFADTAAQRGGSVGNDRASMSLRTLSSAKERRASVALVARLLAHPSFPAEFLVRDKARTVAAIREALTRPESIAERAFWRLAYEEHPYGREPTVESVEAIQREDLMQFHQKHYVANRAIVSMIGDISREEADAIARQLTLSLPQGEPLSALPEVPAPDGDEARIAHPASQAHILMGSPALKRNDPDFFPLTVGNYVLGGGGFVSRLTQEVREKRGLSYSVYSYFNPLAQKGPFQVGLQTQKEQADQALKVVQGTLNDYLRTGPTPAELEAAKSNLIGGFALRLDNNRKILDHIAMIGFYDMPLNYLDTWTERVANVTAEQVVSAFNRTLEQQKMSTVVVGPAAQ